MADSSLPARFIFADPQRDRDQVDPNESTGSHSADPPSCLLLNREFRSSLVVPRSRGEQRAVKSSISILVNVQIGFLSGRERLNERNFSNLSFYEYLEGEGSYELGRKE